MKTNNKTKHLVVSNKTLRAIRKIKREKGFANADVVIKYLLEKYLMEGGDK